MTKLGTNWARILRGSAITAIVLLIAAGCIDLLPESIFDGTFGDGIGQPVPGSGFFDANVVNNSSTSADVTLRFLLVETVVHETVLRRVSPGAKAIIAGPEVATHMVATGTDETGRTLPEEQFTHEGTSDERTLAVYVITDPETPAPPDEPDNPPDDVDTTGPPDDIDTTGPDDVDTTGPDDVDTNGGGGGGGGGGPTITDCNENGIDDALDISAETSSDINTNGTPDECDPDCNTNGYPDDYEIAYGEGVDCDTNGIIDECELRDGSAEDCNGNFWIDSCELDVGSAVDCDLNGMIDSCELAAGSAEDCNTNAWIDSCELAAGAAEDCNTNGVIDSCEGVVCYPPEACCLSEGCQDLPPDVCEGLGGQPLGPETDCASNECPQACCLPYGECTDTTPTECSDIGVAQGVGTTCETASCPQPGACCDNNGNCDEVLETDCTGVFNGEGSSCDGTVCTTACCFSEGECSDLPYNLCFQEGDPQGIGTLCQNTECPIVTQACCFDDGSCQDVQEYECWNLYGTPQGPGSDCSTANCPQTQACCTTDGCFDWLPSFCVGTLMFPLGPGTSCQTDECPMACCHADASCTDETLDDCLRDGRPQGMGSSCGIVSCPIDCQLNGIPDGQELIENDCNENLVPDECDIAGSTSNDTNGNGYPDECE